MNKPDYDKFFESFEYTIKKTGVKAMAIVLTNEDGKNTLKLAGDAALISAIYPVTEVGTIFVNAKFFNRFVMCLSPKRMLKILQKKLLK